MKSRIIDCITFFDNNFMFDFRYNVLKDFVDFFVICESKYDHKGKKKDLYSLMQDKYDEIKKYVSDNRINLKKMSDLARIVNYYNRI